MKKLLVSFFVLLAFFFTANIQAADKYTLDPTHTYVLWHISHFGFSNPSGKWMAQGTLLLDEKKPQDSKLDVTIHTAELSTGLAELDDHLKGELFFDVKKYPTATYVSNKIVMISKTSAKVYGTLTVHGVSKPVMLNVKLNKIDNNPFTDKRTAGFTATTTLKRSDFGMTTLLPSLGDEVTLSIESEAYKA